MKQFERFLKLLFFATFHWYHISDALRSSRVRSSNLCYKLIELLHKFDVVRDPRFVITSLMQLLKRRHARNLKISFSNIIAPFLQLFSFFCMLHT